MTDTKEFLNQYVEDAKRTNPNRIDIKFNPDFLEFAIGMFISSGNILDQIKKNIFYKKPIDNNKLRRDLDIINGYSESLIDFDDVTGIANHFGEEEIDVNDVLFHSVIGIATEATELVEALKKGFPDDVNLLEEFGDLNWYEAIGIDELGGSFDEVLKTNIRKLKHRYPEKFSHQKAQKRDHDGERQILSALAKG